MPNPHDGETEESATIYWVDPATSVIFTGTSGEVIVPDGATASTRVAYDAQNAALEAAAANADAALAALDQSEALAVYTDLIAAGIADATARVLAKQRWQGVILP